MGGIDKRLGRVNTTKSFDDEGEVDEADKHHVEFLESRENASKSLQPSEQSLYLVASLGPADAIDGTRFSIDG